MKNIQCSSKRDRLAYPYLLENHTSINAKSTMAQQLCRWPGIMGKFIIIISIGQTRSLTEAQMAKRWPRTKEIRLPNRAAAPNLLQQIRTKFRFTAVENLAKYSRYLAANIVANALD